MDLPMQAYPLPTQENKKKIKRKKKKKVGKSVPFVCCGDDIDRVLVHIKFLQSNMFNIFYMMFMHVNDIHE